MELIRIFNINTIKKTTMKRLYIYIVSLIIAASTLSSCNDYQAFEYPSIGTKNPTAISNVVATPLPGQIALKWTVPADSNYYFVRVSYFDHLSQKTIVRVASVYKDTLLIPNTRAKFGEYEFKFQTFSRSNVGSAVLGMKAVSGIAPIVVTVIKNKIPVIADQLSTNAQEPTEGAIKNLLDGSLDTYFHTAWSVSIPGPHWMQVDLKKTISNFQFYFGNRNNGSNKPQTVDLMGSVDGTNWQLIQTISQGLPTGAKSEYTSPTINATTPFSMLRLVVQKTNTSSVYFTMSEFSVYEIITKTVNPEL
jgi:hypothetical protein